MKYTPTIRFEGFKDDWGQRKLENVAKKVCVGFVGTCEKFYTDESGVPMYRTGNLNGLSLNRDDLKYVTHEFHQQNQKSQLKTGDILIARHGDSGKAVNYESSEEANCLNIVIIRPDFNKCSDKFLTNCINSPRCQKHIKSLSAGSTQAVINTSEIEKLEVVMPASIDEQNYIARYFSNLDRLITLHQHKYERLKSLKQAMLPKMFPKEGALVPEIRFEGFTEPWEQRKLSEITTMHARIGWQNLRTSEFLDSGDYMLITGTDFNDGAINYSTCHFVERERYEQDKHIQIKNGSILITKDGTLGKVAYVQGLSMSATLNAGVFNVEIKDETEVNDKYLFQYLKAPFLMDYVDKKAAGGTIKHLNQNILVDFPVVMPSKVEQETIGGYFEQLDHLITLHQRKYEKLLDCKKAFWAKMFGGEC